MVGWGSVSLAVVLEVLWDAFARCRRVVWGKEQALAVGTVLPAGLLAVALLVCPELSFPLLSKSSAIRRKVLAWCRYFTFWANLG